MNQLYVSEYAHAAPFDPQRLLELWRRCGLDAAAVERCRPGLDAAERLTLGAAP